MAPLLGLPLQHAVGDVIATERKEIAVCGNNAWREITALIGWDIPDSKSPPPAGTTSDVSIGFVDSFYHLYLII